MPGKITMTAAGPTRSFGPPEPGLLYDDELPVVKCAHRDYFVNFINAYYGKEELEVKVDQVRRVLCFMDARIETYLYRTAAESLPFLTQANIHLFT